VHLLIHLLIYYNRHPEVKPFPFSLDTRCCINEVFLSFGYRKQKTYGFLLFKDGKPIDFVPVKTDYTFSLLEKGWKENGIVPMFLPNSLKISQAFWEEYRQAKTGSARLKLVQEYKLLTDDAILNLQYLAIDVDSPFEKVLPVWEKLKEELGIKRYAIYKTKSGNFRAYIYLKPTFIMKEKKVVVQGKKETITKTYTFYLQPHTKARNGHTHLENARELMHIIYAFFEKHGLKADRTFPNRINHPIYVEGWSIRGKSSKLVEEGKGQAIRLYDLYRKAKLLQKKYELWTFGSINLTEKFWGKGESKEKKETKLVVPSFVAKKIVKEFDDLVKWKIAVRALAEKHTSYRFTKVMMPAVGWAKDLGLDKREVYDYLKELIPDKRNFDEDFEKAWKYADCRFEWKERRAKRQASDYLVEFLRACQEPTSRQELLRKVFGEIKYLLELTEKKALENGLVSVKKVKLTQGRGRKSYVYELTEKGKALLESLQEDKKESLALAVGLDTGIDTQGFEGGQNAKPSPEPLERGLEFSPEKNLCITPPMGEQRSGLVVVGEKNKVQNNAENLSEEKIPNNTAGAVGLGGLAGSDRSDRWAEGQASQGGRAGKVVRLGQADLRSGEAGQKAKELDLEEQGVRQRAYKLIERLKNAWLGELGELPESKGYYKLVFGAVRREGASIVYDLGGWGRFAFALGEVLEELGHKVVYPHISKPAGPPPEPWEEDWHGRDLDWLLDMF
jgi:predicted transcriptional regulator